MSFAVKRLIFYLSIKYEQILWIRSLNYYILIQKIFYGKWENRAKRLSWWWFVTNSLKTELIVL
jgi:hypothetical protein